MISANGWHLSLLDRQRQKYGWSSSPTLYDGAPLIDGLALRVVGRRSCARTHRAAVVAAFQAFDRVQLVAGAAGTGALVVAAVVIIITAALPGGARRAIDDS